MNPFKWTDRNGLASDISPWQPVPIGGSGPGVNPRIVIGSPISISPQTVQNILDFLRSHFSDVFDFGGNTDLINGAVDEASNVGTAVTKCPVGTAQAVKYYSNPAAPYDPNANPNGRGYGTINNTPDPVDKTDFSYRLTVWLNKHLFGVDPP